MDGYSNTSSTSGGIVLEEVRCMGGSIADNTGQSPGACVPSDISVEVLEETKFRLLGRGGSFCLEACQLGYSVCSDVFYIAPISEGVQYILREDSREGIEELPTTSDDSSQRRKGGFYLWVVIVDNLRVTVKMI